ncbi:MAG: virulence factor [Ilumatobacter sp.]
MNDNSDLTAEGSGLGPDQGEMRERRTAGRGGRRRGAAPSIATISWRDIPAQLTARSGGEQHKVLLHARFQHAIDRAAAVAGLTTTEDYVQEWKTASAPLGEGDVAAQLDQRCAEVEAEYPRDRLEALVANGGLEPAAGDGRATAGPDTTDNSAPTLEDLDTAGEPHRDLNDQKDPS